MSEINKDNSEVLSTLATIAENIELLTKAIYYHASKIGYSGDALPALEVKHTKQVKPKAITFDEVRDALNEYARVNGKEKTLDIVRMFDEDANLTNVNPKSYALLIEELR